MPDIFVPPSAPKPTTSGNKSPSIQEVALPKGIHLFSALSYHPPGISFANQEPDETVILLMRRHFITNIPWLIVLVFFLMLPLFIVPFFEIVDLGLFLLPPMWGFFLLIFYYLLVVGYGFTNFLSWFFNVGIATQKRVIDIDYSYITHRNVAISHINDIVDAEYHQGGFFRSFFDYGDISLQTEGIKPNFEFAAVPHPVKVVDVIIDLKSHDTDGN